MGFLASSIGGIAQGIGAFQGASAQREANKTNREINQQNLAARERERADQIAQAQIMQAFMRQVYGDQRADRAEQLALQAKERSEMNPQRALVNESMRQNFRQQGTERDQSKALLEQFRNIREENPEVYENMLKAKSTAAINEAFDNTASQAMRSALRTGASNSGRILAQIGRERAKAAHQGALEAAIQARGATRKEYNEDRNNAAALYNSFAGRASDVPRIQQLAGSQPVRSTEYSGLGDAALVKAFGEKGGTLSFIQPDTSGGQLWSSLGSTLRTVGADAKDKDLSTFSGWWK